MPTTVNSPAPKIPILPLTSVRIFAALYVVLLHSFLWTNRLNVSTWSGRFVRNGYTAVGFFFTLSGFILAHVYLNTDRLIDRRRFWLSRFARAYPLLFCSLLLDAPRHFLAGLATTSASAAAVDTGITLVGESLLLQSWLTPFTTINGPSWSLSAEAFFYLLFPFLAVWLWRAKGRKAVGAFLLMWACAAAAPGLVTWQHPQLFLEVPPSVLQHNVEVMPIFRVFEFFAGIALCSLQQSTIAKLPLNHRSRLGWIAILAAAMLSATAIEFSNSIPLLVMSDGFLLPVYGLTILGLVNSRGWLHQLLSHPRFVLLGEASYAVYLLHGPLFSYVSGVHAIDSPAMWIAYLSVVLGLSIASFVWIERPMRRRILDWASVRPTVSLEQERLVAQ